MGQALQCVVLCLARQRQSAWMLEGRTGRQHKHTRRTGVGGGGGRGGGAVDDADGHTHIYMLTRKRICLDIMEQALEGAWARSADAHLWGGCVGHPGRLSNSSPRSRETHTCDDKHTHSFPCANSAKGSSPTLPHPLHTYMRFGPLTAIAVSPDGTGFLHLRRDAVAESGLCNFNAS